MAAPPVRAGIGPEPVIQPTVRPDPSTISGAPRGIRGAVSDGGRRQASDGIPAPIDPKKPLTDKRFQRITPRKACCCSGRRKVDRTGVVCPDRPDRSGGRRLLSLRVAREPGDMERSRTHGTTAPQGDAAGDGREPVLARPRGLKEAALRIAAATGVAALVLLSLTPVRAGRPGGDAPGR